MLRDAPEQSSLSLSLIELPSVWLILIGLILFLFTLGGVIAWVTLRYIPHDRIGIVEKLWSREGSVPEGSIIALHGEAGFQADVLRGGVHYGYWRWQYRIHRTALVTIPQGQIGYVYARDGDPLPPSQTLGRVVPCGNFQDAALFLGGDAAPAPGAPGSGDQPRGQRGRQRAILREGVYAVNTALFVVITENAVHGLSALQDRREIEAAQHWRDELEAQGGFHPVVVGAAMQERRHGDSESVDSIGIVTIHDGQSLPPGEIIAPAVGTDPKQPGFHNNFQDPEAFLRAHGCRGRQYLPLTDGTYFLNRWFATVEMIPKTVVPIGHVGVVVSYYGKPGTDVSGVAFRHGERVAEGERGVWERPLGPGKYAFNTYAGNIILVPTTNFVLHWITGKTETHRYDESLKSIDLVTMDAYEPLLPLSVVVHIDYQRAPSVIQRFGDVKKLITQTLDPMLSAYFRDIAHRKTMLELLHERDVIQTEAREELRRKFREFDIECVDVLIGKPDTAEAGGKIETLLEQLRQRQLSFEQVETYQRQRKASEELRLLNEAQAQATMQTQLTNARVQAQIAESQGEADLARARKQAEQTVVVAEADLARSRRKAEQTVVLAEADAKEKSLAGRGEGQRVMQVGLAEATVLQRKIASLGDPRLYALAQVAELLSHSAQPLVPERLFVAGDGGASPGAGAGQSGSGMYGLLLSMLMSEKSGIAVAEPDAAAAAPLNAMADRMTQQAVESLQVAKG